LAAAYNPLETDQLYGQGLWGYLEGGADETFRNGATASSIFTELYNIASTETNIGTFWRNLYGGIERANIILDVTPGIQMDSAKAKNIMGQAKFLRAYYYYILATRFGGLEGIPIKSQLTTDMGTNFSLPRTSTDSVYKFIIREMTEAEAMVPAINAPQSWQSAGTTPTVVSKSAIQAILTRVCMSAAGAPLNDKSKYQLALTWANKLIASNIHSLNAAGSPIYPGTPAYAKVFINNVQNNFYETNATEDIWEAAFLSKSTASGAYSGTSYLVTQQLGNVMGIYNNDATASSPYGFGSGLYRVHNKLYNLYKTGDLRRDWAIAPYAYKANTKYTTLAVTFTGVGSGAAATAYTNNAGGISSIVIDNPGSGYTTAPTVTITGYLTTSTTAVTSATATATVSSGKVTGITITKAGSGYPTAYERCVGKWRREYELNVPQVRQQNFTSTNFPIIRYADVLLMAAEADLQVNGGTPSAAAVEYYNQVRRRGYGFAPTTPQPGFDAATFTMQDIMDERSRELCFEGVRRTDLIRWGQMTNAMQSIAADVTANAPSSYITAASLAANNFLSNPSKYLLFPIPATGEIANNPAMTQNGGW